MNQKMVLVDQVTLRQLRGQTEASNRNIFSGLLLEFDNFLGEVSPHEFCMAVVDAFQRCGEHDSFQRIKNPCELVGCFVLRLMLGNIGPIWYHQLVRLAAKQDYAHVSQQLCKIPVQLFVRDPILVTEATISRHVDCENCLSQGIYRTCGFP